jgi:hypothetical protein
MRKKNISIALIFVICAPCFAQNKQQIDTLIKFDLSGLKENFDSIQQEAANLDETERLEIYDRYKKNVWIGGLINLLPGGFGSFIQNDHIGYGITWGGELLGLGAIDVGLSMFLISFLPVLPMAFEKRLQMIINGGALTQAGCFILVPFYLFGIIRAFYYPNAYNKKLKTALWPMPEPVTFSIIPSVNTAGNDVAVTVVSLMW